MVLIKAQQKHSRFVVYKLNDIANIMLIARLSRPLATFRRDHGLRWPHYDVAEFRLKGDVRASTVEVGRPLVRISLRKFFYIRETISEVYIQGRDT